MTDTPDPAARHTSFRTSRETALAESHGWLSVTSLTWIGDEKQQIDNFPGTWWRDGEALHVRLSATEDAALDGVPFLGEHQFQLANEQSDMALAHGDVVAEVIRRDSRYGVRTRDPQAARRTGFRGVPAFDLAPAAVLDAVFSAEEPRREDIGTAHDGVGARATVIGTVRFELAGAPQQLAVTGSPVAPSVVFHDPTNGEETADWRFVGIPDVSGVAPGASAGITLDLNRALSFPAAFIPFGTCPRPVEGNRITVPVRAGEKRPTA